MNTIAKIINTKKVSKIIVYHLIFYCDAINNHSSNIGAKTTGRELNICSNCNNIVCDYHINKNKNICGVCVKNRSSEVRYGVSPPCDEAQKLRVICYYCGNLYHTQICSNGLIKYYSQINACVCLNCDKN